MPARRTGMSSRANPRNSRSFRRRTWKALHRRLAPKGRRADRLVLRFHLFRNGRIRVSHDLGGGPTEEALRCGIPEHDATMPVDASGHYAGTLYRLRGPPYSAMPWDHTLVKVSEAGTARLTFSSGNAALFEYTVDGLSQAKSITREVLRARGRRQRSRRRYTPAALPGVGRCGQRHRHWLPACHPCRR